MLSRKDTAVLHTYLYTDTKVTYTDYKHSALKTDDFIHECVYLTWTIQNELNNKMDETNMW